MEEHGIHLIMDIYTKSEIIDLDKELINFMKDCVRIAKNEIIKIISHKFKPQGFTAIALLKESHMSIHTYPEKDYIALDLYTCGKGNPRLCISYIISKLQPYKLRMIRIKRGNYI